MNGMMISDKFMEDFEQALKIKTVLNTFVCVESEVPKLQMLRGRISQLEKDYTVDTTIVSYEDYHTIDHNLRRCVVSLEGVLSSMWEFIMKIFRKIFGGENSSSGSGATAKKKKSQEDIDAAKEKLKKIEAANAARLKAIADGTYVEPDVSGSFDPNLIRNPKAGGENVKTNSTNMYYDFVINKVLLKIINRLPMLVILGGADNFTLKSVAKGFKRLESINNKEIWDPYEKYLNGQEVYNNKESSDLHFLIKNADKFFGQEMIKEKGGEQVISIDVVSVSGDSVTVLWVMKNRSDKRKHDKKLTYVLKEFKVSQTFKDSLIPSSNTVDEAVLKDISNSIDKISIYDDKVLTSLLKDCAKAVLQFKADGEVGGPDALRIIKMGAALEGVAKKHISDKASLAKTNTELVEILEKATVII